MAGTVCETRSKIMPKLPPHTPTYHGHTPTTHHSHNLPPTPTPTPTISHHTTSQWSKIMPKLPHTPEVLGRGRPDLEATDLPQGEKRKEKISTGEMETPLSSGSLLEGAKPCDSHGGWRLRSLPVGVNYGRWSSMLADGKEGKNKAGRRFDHQKEHTKERGAI